MTQNRLALSTLVLALLAFPPSSLLSQSPARLLSAPRYSVSELTSLSFGKRAQAANFVAMNNHGDLLGGLGQDWYIWRKGVATKIVAPTGTRVLASDMNDRCQVVGWISPINQPRR